MQVKYKATLVDNVWSVFPESRKDIQEHCLVAADIWDKNASNNDNKIINGKFVPNHIPEREYWMNGIKHILVHPAKLPEGASFEKPNEIVAKDSRELRNQLLRKSDWAVLPDAPLTEKQKQEWQAYRQALRDIPQQSGFPEFVIVPEVPVKVVG